MFGIVNQNKRILIITISFCAVILGLIIFTSHLYTTNQHYGNAVNHQLDNNVTEIRWYLDSNAPELQKIIDNKSDKSTLELVKRNFNGIINNIQLINQYYIDTNNKDYITYNSSTLLKNIAASFNEKDAETNLERIQYIQFVNQRLSTIMDAYFEKANSDNKVEIEDYIIPLKNLVNELNKLFINPKNEFFKD